jgi:ribose transport system substrate-binding protein
MLKLNVEESMKKWGMLVLVCLIAAGAVFAGGQGEAKAQKSGKKQIALIVKEMNTDFWIGLKQGAEDAAKKYNIDLVTLSPEKYSVELQIRIMEDMIQKKVDAIVIAPIDGNGIVSGVERANAAGIPVMGCNTAINGGTILGFAGIDHITSGRALGEYFVKKLNGKGDIVILEGTTGASSAQEMLAGIHQIIDKYPDIKVLASTTAKYNRELGMKVMEDLLTRFPKIDAVLAMNDVMALGAKEAVREANRKIMIGGINALPEAIDAVKKGELEVTVDASGYIQGYVATELTCKYLTTGEKPPAVTKIGVGEAEAISRANVDEFIKKRAK